MPSNAALAEENPRVAIGANDPPAEARLSIEELVDNDPSIVLTDDEKRAELFAFVESEIAAFEPDLATAKGRKEIASFARRFVSKKTAIDGAGKSMNEAARAQINVVDAARRTVREKLDGFADQARSPLTEWEQEQKERAEAADAMVAKFKADAVVPMGDTAAAVRQRGFDAFSTEVDRKALGDDADRVQEAKDYAVGVLKDALRRLTKEEADHAELQRLRDAEAERQRQDNERRAAEEAERRQQEAERVERGRIARIEKEAEERAAAQAARQHEAEIAAERERAAQAEAAAQAEIDRLAQEEANRIATAAREAEERAEREADQDHRTKVKTTAKEAIIALGVPEAKAIKVVQAIVAGDVPRVRMEF